MQKVKTDICIIGGGSGGFGAAIQAARRSNGEMDIVLVEASGMLGGNSTAGGVNCWEPSISAPGIHFELHRKITGNSMYAGMGEYKKSGDPHGYWWAMMEMDNNISYNKNLRRKYPGRFVFEPEAMSKTMEDLLLENRNMKIMYHTVMVNVQLKGERIHSVIVYSAENGQYVEIESATYIDCTGDIHLARVCGCETAMGEDARGKYNEPSAPEMPSDSVNGVTQIFRVSPGKESRIDPLPGWIKDTDAVAWAHKRKPDVCINIYPNGDLNFNILPVMEGNEYHKLPADLRNKICKARALVYWNIFQKEIGFEKYYFKYFAPKMGVRESYRLAGKYVLTELDVRAGYLAQNKKDEIIAFCDHAIDNHSDKEKLEELEIPYGIPFDSLLPLGIENLAVACRGASFSHIASATCRLSRVMIALGEAAGTAAFMAVKQKKCFHEINPQELRNRLRIPEFTESIHNEKEWEIVNI